MTHRHLRLDFTRRFKDNSNYYEERRTTERYRTELVVENDVYYERYYRYDTKEKCSDKSNSVKNLRYIIGGGLTGTDTRNKAAVLLQVIRYLDRIEGNENVEVSEKYDEYEEQYYVYPRIIRKEIKELLPEATRLGSYYHFDGTRKRDYGVCEDYRHNATHIELYGESCALSAVHLTSDDLLCVLNRQTAFAVRDIYYEGYHCKSREAYDLNYYEAPGIGESVVDHTYYAGSTGCDYVGKEYDRDTVSDTVVVYLFRKPHYERRSRGVTENYYEPSENGVTEIGEVTVVSHIHIVTERGKKSEKNGNYSGPLGYYFLTLLASLGNSFKSGDCYGQELHNDRSRNVRRDRKCEQRCF